MKPLVTVICPVYNEEKTIPIFYGRVAGLFARLEPTHRCNLVFVDNCSSDRSLSIIKEIRQKDPRVFHLGLSINGGYQKSMEAGLKNAEGDFFAIVDVDCEDPPEMIEEFINLQKDGYDIVYGERVDRSESYLVKSLRKVFYRVTRFVSDEHFFVDMAEFCLITAEVRNALIQDTSSFPFIRASIGRVGFTYKGVPYKRHPRVAGKSNFNLYRMTTFAVAGILSSSTLPLRFMVYCFPFLALTGLISAIGLLPTTAFYFFGVFYLSLGLMFNSIYMARVYKNSLGRPNAFYVERKTVRQPKI
jgi:glycosyltransferase involved in cell wall biosynthesis